MIKDDGELPPSRVRARAREPRALVDVIRTYWKGTTLYSQVPVLNQGLDNLYKLVQVEKKFVRDTDVTIGIFLHTST
jgi:hypothetical protein